MVYVNAEAMTLVVPFRCHEQALIKAFKDKGINLDKSDEYSDGFIENCGSSYKIHLYENTTDLQVYIDVPRQVYKEYDVAKNPIR